MQIPYGMTPFNHNIKIENDFSRQRTAESSCATDTSAVRPTRDANAVDASQQSRVMAGAGAGASAGAAATTQTGAQEASQQASQQAGGGQAQGGQKQNGLQKLFAAIQKGMEQLLNMIPVLGNLLKSLLPKGGGQGGAAGVGAG